MSKAIHIKTSGEIIQVEPKNGTDFQLDELQAFVGGHIEMAQTKDGRYLIANEEGLRKKLPFNALATDYYIYGNQSEIVGDVLICDPEQVK